MTIFNHVNLDLPKLERELIDNVRYYKLPSGDKKLVSITSVISHYKKDFFLKWRKRIGEEKAERITSRSTKRGTGMHTLIENYLYNEENLPEVPPLSKYLFYTAKPYLNRINNIHGLETSMYSEYLGIAGTCDCIAEFDGELSIIDFKSSAQPKPVEWVESYFVQCAAYAAMLHELTGISVKKFVIIMSCENGDCVVYEEYDKEKYLRLLVTYIKKFINDKLSCLT